MMGRVGIGCCMFLFLLLLTGCVMEFENETLEELGMARVMGIDYRNEKEIDVTISLPPVSEEKAQKSQKYHTTVELIQQAPRNISAKSDKSIRLSQLRVILFSEEFARKKGIGKVIKSLYRDPQISDNVLIGIVKGSAEDVIKGGYPGSPDVNALINDLLRERKETAFNPFTDLHTFIYRVTDGVSDPLVPYIEQKENSIQITKIALFRGDKMIGSISPRRARMLAALRGREKIPDLTINLKEEKGGHSSSSKIVLNFVGSKLKIKSKNGLKSPAFDIELSFTASVLQYTGKHNLQNPAELAQVEKEINQAIKRDVEGILQECSAKKIDPLRLGAYVRADYRGKWSKEKWRQALQKAVFRANVHTEIYSTGTVK